MSIDKQPMTIVGKEKLEAELKQLLTVERPMVIKAIAEARAHGDLSENADYDAAKEKQGFVEDRIRSIQGKIASSEVIDPSKIDSEIIVFAATVHLEDCDAETKMSYQIVGEDEANVKDKKISVFSPLARVLIGKKVGDIVEFKSPKGDREYEVLGLEFK